MKGWIKGKPRGIRPEGYIPRKCATCNSELEWSYRRYAICLTCRNKGLDGRTVRWQRAQRVCEKCGTPFGGSQRSNRRRFCSRGCANSFVSAGAKACCDKSCGRCGKTFKAKPAETYCSAECRKQSKREANGTLERQIKRLLLIRQRYRTVTFEDVMGIYERQGGLCALTGQPLTHVLGKRKVLTNLSLDRVDSTKGYEASNIQLTCVAANLMKRELPQDLFLEWCRKIVKYADSKPSDA